MSQITTCPSCGTRFRVVADQLRISDGWVRCGQCQEVFDARNYLDAIVPAAPQRVEPPPPPAVPSAPAAAVAEPIAEGRGRGADALEPPAPVVSPVTSASAPAAVPVRTPLPMIEVPAPRAPETEEAAAPGYELPAPTWADDFDFSDYQATAPEAAAEAPPALEQPSEPVMASSSTPPEPAPSPLPAEVQAFTPPPPPWSPSADPWPQATDPAPSPLVEERQEPAWTVEAEQAAPPAQAPDFPPLDVSVLPQPRLASAPGSVQDAWSENTDVGSLHQTEVLPKDEYLGADAPWADTSATPLHGAGADGVTGTAAPVVPDPQVAAAEAQTPTAPWDAIESAAQKLAQAEVSPAEHAAANDVVETSAEGAAAASAPFPFAPPDDGAYADAGQEFGFVRDARRKAWWQKPAVRVAMGAGVVVLPVALALQIALHERNALAAWQPDLRPGLEFMCTALQCQLGPRQQTGAVVVSGSSFAKVEQERSYQLNLSMQNRARTPMGVPAVELTLTDAQDQAIARKVISAKALGAPAELAAGAEWSGSVPVTTNGLNLQVVGYRVLLFYP